MREPDYKNTTDPSYKTIMDKFEFSYDTAHKLYANTTNVDYTCLSLIFEMLDKDSHSLGKGGFPCSQAALYQGLLANPELRKMSTPYRFFSPSILKPGQTGSHVFPAHLFSGQLLETLRRLCLEHLLAGHRFTRNN